MFDVTLLSLLSNGFVDWATTFLAQYGYLALLLFVFAETSSLFPFLPSELVVPAAAALLVTGPVSLLAFVAVATVGATAGSLFAYYAFGTGSSRLVERFGSRIQVSETEIERARGWFRRWGESSVFWGRLLPGLRSVISIPAGFAGMSVGKFAFYSGTGSGLFAAGVGGVVLYGFDGRPSAVFVSLLDAGLAYARAAPVLVVAACLLALFVALLARNAYAERLSPP